MFFIKYFNTNENVIINLITVLIVFEMHFIN
jgi:hypothetical protein